MENVNLPNQASNQAPQPMPASPVISSKQSYFSKLFTGRLNRAGYFAGGTAAGFILTVLFACIYVGLSFITTMQIAMLISLPIYIVTFTFFISSLTIRRLHDLNKSAYFSLIIIPGWLFFFLELGLGMSGTISKTSYVFTLLNTISKNVLYTGYNDLSDIFGLILLFWPGTKTTNKYGEPSTHWSIKEIFGFATPRPANTDPNVPIPPPTSKKLVKPFLMILVGLVVLLVLFVGGIFVFGFIQGFFNH